MSSHIDWSILALSRTTVDRAAERRDDPALIPTLLTEPSTTFLLVRGGEIAIAPTELGQVSAPDGGPSGPHVGSGPSSGVGSAASPRLAVIPAVTSPIVLLLPAADAADLSSVDILTAGEPGPTWFFLGRKESGAVLGLVIPQPTAQRVDIEGVEILTPLEALSRSRSWAALRDVGHELNAHDAGLATAAVALAAWHERAVFCPGCGQVTAVTRAGWARRCHHEGQDLFPRTDPAVIMTVTDDEDRLLLGHAAHWPAGRFSTLAGFVEAGESAEHAVRREVAEETGVLVGDVVYRASQPWPFPASLMFGFHARALTTEITVDGVEVTDARWFTRTDLIADVASGTVTLPMRSSIARALIDNWCGEGLNEADRTRGLR